MEDTHLVCLNQTANLLTSDNVSGMKFCPKQALLHHIAYIGSTFLLSRVVPVWSMPFGMHVAQSGPIAWPLEVLLAARTAVRLLVAFSRTAHLINFALDTALPCVLSNVPTKC